MGIRLLLAAALVLGVASTDGEAALDSTDPAALGLMQGYPLPAGKLVTLSNWLDFPYVRWSLRNMQALQPTSRLHVTTPPAKAFPKGTALDVRSLAFLNASGALVTGALGLELAFMTAARALHAMPHDMRHQDRSLLHAAPCALRNGPHAPNLHH